MAEHKERSSGALVIALALVVMLGLPALYVLSIGPVVWLERNDYLPEWGLEVVSVIYLPLEYAVTSSQWVEQWAEWYVSFWE